MGCRYELLMSSLNRKPGSPVGCSQRILSFDHTKHMGRMKVNLDERLHQLNRLMR